jgi:hypothetical protein
MRLCFADWSLFSLTVVLCTITWAGRANAKEAQIADDLQQPGCDECYSDCETSSACTSCRCERCCCCDPFMPMMIGAASPAPLRIAQTAPEGDFAFLHRGMERIADNNSPLPQDRVAFSYNLLGNAPKVAGDNPSTIDISQFDLLMEKTLLCGAMSVGVNVPFSHTVSSHQVWIADTSVDEDTELGNVSMTLKGLLWNRPCLKISGGVLIETPTSDDLNLDVGFRNTLKQNTWYFSPFLAALATPTDRLFYHGFISYRDSTGPNDQVAEGTFIGTLRDPDLLMVDGGFGYWLYENQCCHGITAVVPTVELHYITTTTDMDGWSGDLAGRVDYLYLTAGVTTRIGQRNTLALGCAAPLREGDNPVLGRSDRLYDWQLVVQWNYFCWR